MSSSLSQDSRLQRSRGIRRNPSGGVRADSLRVQRRPCYSNLVDISEVRP